jgi:hypothetical protein
MVIGEVTKKRITQTRKREILLRQEEMENLRLINRRSSPQQYSMPSSNFHQHLQPAVAQCHAAYGHKLNL